MRRYLSHPCVGRQRYGRVLLGPLLRWWPRPGLVEPQYEVFAVSPISAGGGLDDIHPMRRGGVKSFVDDLVLGRGVVISRAATSLRSVETQPLTRRFVRFRRTHLRRVCVCLSVTRVHRMGAAMDPEGDMLA